MDLRKYRKKIGATQAQMARMLEVSRITYNSYEKHPYSMPLDKAIIFCWAVHEPLAIFEPEPYEGFEIFKKNWFIKDKTVQKPSKKR